MAVRGEFRPGSEPAVDYAAFGSWYDMYRADVLDPALVVAEVALGGVLHDVLSDRDLARIRRPVGRVKAKPRVWRKLGDPRYSGRVGTVHDIPDVIDDLIGVRLTCTNRRDIDVVREVFDALPTTGDGGTELWLDPASERDYLDVPRPSGYRGWHVNLGVGLDVAGVRRPVTCELQVRTLLQDGWGELTHEDSYKKDGDLPPLVEVLSRRMADLLATLDDIAEDLRDELDRRDEAAVVGSPNSEPQTRRTTGGSPEQSIDASAHLEARWRNLDRPLDLASLAWEVQREYGAEISDDWFGFGTFKRFIESAAPDAEITAGRHAYLLPAELASDDAAAEDVVIETDDQTITAQVDARASDIPPIARALHRVDRTFPLLTSDRWCRLFDHLAEAWHRTGSQPPTDQLTRRLVQSTCDRSAASGPPLARRHVEAVVRDLVTEGDGTPQAACELADSYATLAQHRLVELRLIGSRNRTARAALRQWIVPSTR
jgi:ppGpp synthetase/RelA/SpoT-type nucleotidyltranferase